MITDPSHALIDGIADRLAHPSTAYVGTRATDWRRQSLAHGLPGIALLHIERAAAGLGPWQRAHAWLAAASRGPFTSGADSHMFYGAPAFAHALSCVADHLPDSYRRALEALDRQMTADVSRRLGAAHRRIDAGHLPVLAEFDTIRGLAGYGGYLLRRDPRGSGIRAILDYCVRLTMPIAHGGDTLPGWWTDSGPSGRPDQRFRGGHANMGMAHGIGGVLALLSLASRQGVRVNGHHDAVRAILSWLDRWRVETPHGPAWPYWVTREHLRSGPPQPPPRRPSWCYGTAGQARAQQLAALALNDIDRQADAERALVAALTDPEQLEATTDNGLCHGFAGLAHVATRVAEDARPETAEQLRAVIPVLLNAVLPSAGEPFSAAESLLNTQEGGPGLLDGAAGVALAFLPPITGAPPRSRWDACLLIA